MKTVTAATANRQFSSLLREVSSGQVVTVLSRGKPVATMAPVRRTDPDRNASRSALLDRLARQAASGSRDWVRESLYDE
jgi:prevent-host-death family protein